MTNLTEKESNDVHKKAVLERSKASYSESPMKDSQIKEETLEVAKAELGISKAEELLIPNKYLDFEIDLESEDIGGRKTPLNFEFFTSRCLDTEHIPGYNLFEKDLGLDGGNYRAMKKALAYFQHSIRQDTVSYRLNKRTLIDNRQHLLIISSAGSGKSTIKNSIKRVLKNCRQTEGCIEVSGVSHPEQLVGKNIYKGREGNKKCIPVYGLLAYKSLLNDEAQEMLNEKNDVYAKSQRLKRIAMDSFSLNHISKKLVSDTPEETFEYDSPTRICDFAHPKKLESVFFDTGSFRRYLSFLIEPDENLDLDDITKFEFDDGLKNEDWSDYLDGLYSSQVEVKFSEQTLRIISHFHKTLLFFLLKHQNQTAFRYALQTRYSLRDTFCKNVLILSKAKKEETPLLLTTINACSDTILFILKSIETYNSLGNMGATSDLWGGVSDQDAQALEYLLKNGDLSKNNSKTTIKKFNSLLANFYGCRESQSRAHFYRLKRDGFVDGCQVGKNDSRVWLTFIPKEINVLGGAEDPFEFWENEFKGVSVKKTLLAPLKKMFNDDKTFEYAKGVGGVSVMICLLIKYYTCVEVYSNFYFFNNNKENEFTHYPTPSPQAPLKENKTPPTIKRSVKGDKTPKITLTPLKQSKSDRDTQYWDDPVTSDIQNCDKNVVLEFLKQNPNCETKELMLKFGAGVLNLKKEGLIK